MSHVIEWAPFRLKNGVTEADILAASDALQVAFLASQPGFVRRELVRADDGRYIDIVCWATKEAADEAVANAAKSASCGRYFSLMQAEDHDDPNAAVSHFRVVKRY